MTYAHPTATGRTLTLYLVDGTPSGVTKAELGDFENLLSKVMPLMRMS